MGFVEEIERLDNRIDKGENVVDAALESMEDIVERVEKIEETISKDKPLFDSMVKQVARLMLDVVELQAHLKEQFKRQ